VSPSGAIAVGGLAGGICCLAISLKNKFGFDDALDVVGVHLVGGLAGTLLIGFFATKTTNGFVDGLFYGGDASQLGKQAIAAFAVMGYSFFATLIIALILKYTIGLRVSEEAEIVGIDQSEHAETAYEFTPVATGSNPGAHSYASSPAQRVVT
jgi:Amt family ammonium transporter